MGILTFSKKKYQNPQPPEQKEIVKISKNKWFTSHLLFKIDRSKAWCQVKIPTRGICVIVKFPWFARPPFPLPSPRWGLTLIFPYNSLYTQAVAYTTYFELEKPVICGTSHVSYRWGVKSAVKLSFGAGTAALGLNDINRRMQLLQSLVVYSLALFYGLLICLRLLWETIRKLKIPPGAKRRETRKQKISWGSEIFTYFWQCVQLSLKCCWFFRYTVQLLHAFSTLSLENTTS